MYWPALPLWSQRPPHTPCSAHTCCLLRTHTPRWCCTLCRTSSLRDKSVNDKHTVHTPQYTERRGLSNTGPVHSPNCTNSEHTTQVNRWTTEHVCVSEWETEWVTHRTRQVPAWPNLHQILRLTAVVHELLLVGEVSCTKTESCQSSTNDKLHQTVKPDTACC